MSSISLVAESSADGAEYRRLDVLFDIFFDKALKILRRRLQEAVISQRSAHRAAHRRVKVFFGKAFEDGEVVRGPWPTSPAFTST